MPRWSPWPWPGPCRASTARPAGCASPTPTSRDVRLPAPAAGARQAPAGRSGAGQTGDPVPGHGHRTCCRTRCGSWTPPLPRGPLSPPASASPGHQPVALPGPRHRPHADLAAMGCESRRSGPVSERSEAGPRSFPGTGRGRSCTGLVDRCRRVGVIGLGEGRAARIAPRRAASAAPADVILWPPGPEATEPSASRPPGTDCQDGAVVAFFQPGRRRRRSLRSGEGPGQTRGARCAGRPAGTGPGRNPHGCRGSFRGGRRRSRGHAPGRG